MDVAWKLPPGGGICERQGVSVRGAMPPFSGDPRLRSWRYQTLRVCGTSWAGRLGSRAPQGQGSADCGSGGSAEGWVEDLGFAEVLADTGGQLQLTAPDCSVRGQ